MKAIIEDRTRHYTVTVGDTLAIDKLEGAKEGEELTFDSVLMITDDKNTTKFGSPFISGSKVTATIVDNEIHDPKITVFKFKRRKNYKRTKGHKQHRTLIKIKAING